MPIWTSPSKEHEALPRALIYFVALVTLASLTLHVALSGWGPRALWQGATLGATGSLALFLLWNHGLWKWRPFGVGRPHVWGTWRGTLSGHYRLDEEAGTQHIEMTVYGVVRQSATSASYEQLQDQSRSHTLYSRLVQRDGKWILRGAYQNYPHDQSLEQHRGSYELILTNEELDGVYWNERWSRGKLQFTERRPVFVATLKAVKQLFGDAEHAEVDDA